MTGTLYRLAYYSLNALPVDRDTAAEVHRILEVSRANNARANITGALLFNRGCFAQILEGDYAAIERVFEVIQNDERHTSVVPLQFEAVAELGFGPWSMAHVGTDTKDAGRYDGIGSAADVNPASCTGAELFKALHTALMTQERL